MGRGQGVVLPGWGMLLALAVGGEAEAASFALMEQSGSGMGNAFAGGAAAAEDASTVFFNPAGLTRLTGTQAVGAAHLIVPSVEFTDRGSTSAAGTPMTGGDGGDAGTLALLPNFYLTLPLTPTIRFGLGVSAPFGLVTEYDPDWTGRYHATTSDLRTVNVNPALAFEVTERLSVGVGFNLQWARADLQSAVDFGSICLGQLGPGVCVPLGLTPQAADGYVRIGGDSLAYGYNAGVLWQATDSLRIGAHYRSKLDHELGNGRVDFGGVPALFSASPAFADGAAGAKLTLPESASVSLYADLTPAWAVMADVTWTAWSRFESLDVTRPSGLVVTSAPQNYEDSMRYSVGVTHRLGDRWKLRGGLAYDQTPVQDAFRSPRVPDNDRVWLAAGVAWSPWSGGVLDLGYAHVFIDDTQVDLTAGAAGRLRGDYSGRVDLLSLQYTHSF